MNENIKIIYEDKYILAAVKPPGMLSQSEEGEDIISLLPEAKHIINRLDRPVGGITLLTKDSPSAAALTEQLQNGGIAKKYLAVVCAKGFRAEDNFTDYLAVNSRLNLTKAVNKGMPGAKEARLGYRLLSEGTDCSLLEVSLYTGRHHQIRAQLAHHNMPIWGDTKYNPLFKHKRGVLPALFACSLSFAHPVTGDAVELCTLPDYGKFLDFIPISIND